jgi:hypothetical protein
MKIGGVTVTPSEEILVLPRPTGNIVFRAKAVAFSDAFDKICPEPVPPMVTTKDGRSADLSDPDYKKAVAVRDSRRFAYMMIRCLEASDIEWSTVDLEKPGTWMDWTKELIEAGLSEVELSRVINAAMSALSLDEAKIAKAREDFLRGQGA